MKIKSFNQFLNEFEIEGDVQPKSNIKSVVFEVEDRYGDEDISELKNDVVNFTYRLLSYPHYENLSNPQIRVEDIQQNNGKYISVDIYLNDNELSEWNDILDEMNEWVHYLHKYEGFPMLAMREWSA